MRPWTLLALVGCLAPGRRDDLALSLRVEPLSREPAWDERSATLDAAILPLSSVTLREPLDARWGADRFDDRPSSPFEEGVAAASWSGEAAPDLMDPTQAWLGLLEAHEGLAATGEVRVRGTLALVGEVELDDGRRAPCALELPLEEVARALPVQALLRVDREVVVAFDLAAVLAVLDWEARVDGWVDPGPDEVRAVRAAVRTAEAWRVTTR